MVRSEVQGSKSINRRRIAIGRSRSLKGMSQMRMLMRVASETNIKSVQVRKYFMRRLVQNMQAALKHAKLKCEISPQWGRLFGESDDECVQNVLSRVFGLHSVSPVMSHCDPTLDAVLACAQKFADNVAGKTFKVRVRRADVSGFTSVEAERKIGAVLFPFAKGVDLENPDYTLHVEIRREGAFFYDDTVKAPGGLPVGVQGKVLCLLSGGIDSAVAAWSLLKRGVEVDFLFCNLGGSAYERSVLRVAKTFADLWCHGYQPKLFVADFGSILLPAIKEQIQDNLKQVLLKRCMYRVGNMLAPRINAQALVTGESIGQVSSQTLPNLCAIDIADALTVLRPLVALDKDEIMQKCREIGMYTVCASVREYCNITTNKPHTRATREHVDRQESLIDTALYESTLNTIKTYSLTNLDDSDLGSDYLFVNEVPNDAVLLDCREPRQFEMWHYPGSVNRPADELLRSYRRLAKEKTYVLCCPYGLQSAALAETMQEAGYEAYSLMGGVEGLRSRNQ